MNQALKSTQTFPIDSPKQLQAGSRAAPHPIHSHSSSHPKHSVNSGATFDLATSLGPEILEPMPEFADQTVLVYTHIEMLAHYDHVPMGYMNRTNWIPQAEPLAYISREQWNEHQLMPQVEATGEWVDIVVNNIDDKGHPFHLVCAHTPRNCSGLMFFSLAWARLLRPDPAGLPSPCRLPNIQPFRPSFAFLPTLGAGPIPETEYGKPTIERYDSYPETRIRDFENSSR